MGLLLPLIFIILLFMNMEYLSEPTVDSIQKMPHISEISPHLYIGNCFAASSPEILHELKISSVVNVAQEIHDPYIEPISNYKFSLQDTPGSMNPISAYVLAAQSVLQLLKMGEVVLVHCQAGISRSTAICCLVLAILHGRTLQEAFNHISSIRPGVYIMTHHLPLLRPSLDLLRELF